jgi:hypothetical protein
VPTENTSNVGDDLPGEHHLPPERFDQITLQIRVISANERLFRIHSAKCDPIYFGRSGQSRFDAPSKEYGGLYVALSPYGAFRETVLRQTTYKIVDRRDLQIKAISTIQVNRELRLADLTGAGLAWIGADARLTTGSYRISQQWSLALWQHPQGIDGIFYRSRLDPDQLCILLFEDRFKEGDITERKLSSSLLEYQELLSVLEYYQYGLND